ncbi:uncharacterized protein [Rutidosis leptorrhynchoides]|uniref:uncharacterized protein n=1 Tax=Rutidosis leptorrhynchoides TaxID=125765 RepID=UPI003A991B2D
MEGKKINFNRPLLSVRRNYGTTTADSQKNYSSRTKNETVVPTLLPSPSNKSDMYSDPVSVPFVWEQSPGRPKDETKSQKHPIVPKLPPGRISKPTKQDLDIINRDFRPIMKDIFHSSDVYMDANHPPKMEPRETKIVVNRGSEKPQITYGPNFLELNDDDDGDREEEREFDYDDHENMSSYKVCGLVPHFCLKGSVGLLNPVPGLSVRSRLPVSSANTTRACVSSVTLPDQPARATAYEHRSLVKNQNEPSVLKNESTEATNRIYDRLQSNEISNSNLSERKEVNIQKKGLISFKELLAYDKAQEADFQNFALEKTLYVDTVHKVESVKSDFKENDEGIFGISYMSTEPFKPDLLAVKLKEDKETMKQTDVYNIPKVDQKVNDSRPAPPPLPKSPSDSWLWRTLPSASSKTTSLRSKPKAKLEKNAQSIK